MKTHLLLIIALLLLTGSVSAQDKKPSALLAAAIYEEEVTGNLDKAVELFLDILKKYPDDRPVAAKTLYHLGLVNEKMGKQKASDYFTRLINNYPDQTELVAMAKEKLAALGGTGTTSHSEMTMHRIWVAGLNPIFGISQDGRYVVFRKAENGDLWLHNLQTGEQRQITHDASWVEWSFAEGRAAISPDGKQIAYDWTVRNYGELRLSVLDGSFMRVLHNGQDGRRMSVSSWMPDGLGILAVSYDNKDQSYRWHIISLADNTIRDIGQPDPEYLEWRSFSPDGRQIAYCRSGDIFIYDIPTEQESVFVQNPATDAVAGWTPDGSGIVFVSNRSGTYDLYLLGIENGQPRGEIQLLQKDFGANPGILLTRDGRLFRSDALYTFDSFIVPVDELTGKPTGPRSQVDLNYPNAAFPKWSPDGKLLYYEIYKQASEEQLLFIRSEVTGQTREITLKPKLNFWHSPILSPDGKQFAITGSDENMNFGIFAIDSESGDVSQLARIPVENNPVLPNQNWSPDGQAIFYTVRSPEERSPEERSPEESEEFIIRRKDLLTGEEKDVYRGMHTRRMKISSDGNRFVYYRNDMPNKSYVVGILDIQSGKELELWRIPEADGIDLSDPIWTPDERYVIVAKLSMHDTELWRIPVTGGPGEKLHIFPENTYDFVMHPNGNQLAFTQYQVNNELWVLENFLPK
jgi:Tol biopolymer transport system component